MSEKTDIQWADSTVNAEMGCDGCELWKPANGVKICYAANFAAKNIGTPGWPSESFSKPELFPHRIKEAARWADLTGKERPEKPWLSGYPRMIFLDDMGDTFTESLPLDWLMPHIATMENSPHIWLFLTKRAKRMRKFFEQLGRVPANFWLGVTVTSNATLPRAFELAKIPGARRWMSIEPLIGNLDLADLMNEPNRPEWIALGGESGAGAKPMDLSQLRRCIFQSEIEGSKVFVKQMGTAFAKKAGGHSKGGDWSIWPSDFRIRELPEVRIDNCIH